LNPAYGLNVSPARHDRSGIVISRERRRPLESVQPGNQHAEPPLNGSAQSMRRTRRRRAGPPATTAAWTRSRRVPGMPFASKHS